MRSASCGTARCRDLLTALAVRRVDLHRREHVAYLTAGLGNLSAGFVSLDASRPWICYWIVHALELLAPPSSLVPAHTDAIEEEPQLSVISDSTRIEYEKSS